MLKKTLPILLVLPLAALLWGADFWDSKPYTDWNEKEVDKILNNSPWGAKLNVRTGQQGVVAQDQAKGAIMGEIEVPVYLRWRTALPIKQAFAKAQPSPQTQQLLERQETSYVLQISGLPGSARADVQDIDALKSATVLKVKGKEDVHPAEIQLPAAPAPKGPPAGAAPGLPPSDSGDTAAAPAGRGGGRGGRGGGAPVPAAPGGGGGFGGGFGGNFDLFVSFPKDAVSASDKEFEFSTKIGKLKITRKFKVADMMFGGKFEM